jgi:hypothetical protein
LQQVEHPLEADGGPANGRHFDVVSHNHIVL